MVEAQSFAFLAGQIAKGGLLHVRGRRQQTSAPPGR